MNPDTLKLILEKHLLWRKGLPGGERADLARANLAGADLARANLARANLARAYLAGADLAGANLAGAYLAGAYLAGANLADANLADANLAQARGITYSQVAFSGHGECGRLLSAVKLDGEWKLFCGCFKGTFDDLDAYIRDGKAEHRESRTLARNVLRTLCDHEDQKGSTP